MSRLYVSRSNIQCMGKFRGARVYAAEVFFPEYDVSVLRSKTTQGFLGTEISDLYNQASSVVSTRRKLRRQFIGALYPSCESSVLRVLLFTNSHLLDDQTLLAIGKNVNDAACTAYLRGLQESRRITINA